MGFAKDFKQFAMRGNVVDLAVGIIIGAAFGKIVSSLVSDVVMPPIGVLIGGMDFSSLAVTLKPAVVDAAGAVTTPAVAVRYGAFVNTIIDFVIVAFAIFLLVKAISSLRRKEEIAAAPAAPAAPVVTKSEVLLSEIRDLLKARA